MPAPMISKVEHPAASKVVAEIAGRIHRFRKSIQLTIGFSPRRKKLTGYHEKELGLFEGEHTWRSQGRPLKYLSIQHIH
jgi:hypothetical protein